MEPDRILSSDPSTSKSKSIESEKAEIIEWEDYEHEVARLWSLSSALNESKQKKQNFEQKLRSLIQVKEEALSRLNELEDMKERVEARKLVIERIKGQSKVAADNSTKEEEGLSSEVRSLLVAGTALSVASKQLQAYVCSLSKSDALKMLLRGVLPMHICFLFIISYFLPLLRVNIQQVFHVYLCVLCGLILYQLDLQRSRNLNLSQAVVQGTMLVLNPVNQGSLTILGLNLTMAPFTKMSFFTDKKEVQRSASALGYVAHAVSLIAYYLEAPLRYPIRLGGSNSYIIDFAPSVEATPSDLLSSTLSTANIKPVEFPLFLEGQDTTRAAYAVFLLNKDLEQLLNYIGVRSLGPRHVLANLKELTRTIQSAEFLDT
ncbi:hypothetical protein OIU78_025877 [Salix suchowensis]|nr:hypothetical protein OIU78_025877 [Salix suchowensis]